MDLLGREEKKKKCQLESWQVKQEFHMDEEIEFELYYLPELVANVTTTTWVQTHLQQIPTFILVIPHILKKSRRLRSV